LKIPTGSDAKKSAAWPQVKHNPNGEDGLPLLREYLDAYQIKDQ